jgi:predicted nucleotidyltransferase
VRLEIGRYGKKGLCNMHDISIIKEAVHEIIPVNLIEQIIIFGSHARGDATEDSDTDICIITTSELTRDEIKQYTGGLNKVFARKYRMPTDILIKSKYAYSRYKNVAGAIECSIATEGVSL